MNHIPKHTNGAVCERCELILDRYPGFYGPLREWFYDLRKAHPEAHTSCAGRGRQDQEALFLRKATRAKYGESAHNWNAALDIFEYWGDLRNIYEPQWFWQVLRPALTPDLTWLGNPGSSFHELPHVQWRNWYTMKNGALKLVEV